MTTKGNKDAPEQHLPYGVHVQLHLVQAAAAQRLQPQQLHERIHRRVNNACRQCICEGEFV